MAFGDHLCLPYDGEEERDAVLRAYIGVGFDLGHRILLLAGDDGAADRLPIAAAARRAALADGSLVVRAGPPGDAEAARALRAGFTGLRVIGDTALALRGCVPGCPPHTMMICPYDRRWFDEGRLLLLEDAHQGRVRVDDLYDDGVLRVTPTHAPPGLRLAGALDESTLPGLREALFGVPGGRSHFCLDIAELEFCDMEGLRVLMGAGLAPSGLDRQVIVRGAPGYLGLMMRIAGWESVPGVVLEEAV
ncbi:MEDS domain-containing protein [Spirillospora sp. CA-294931]|uniref:MEDS domain-containing protein n=1 Tax=Spirillospora sp. CA-294931 TaxID=3240042 RepID=UPI003D919EF1